MSEIKFNDLLRTQSLYFASASTFNDADDGRDTRADHRQADASLARQGFDEAMRQKAADARRNAETWNRGAVLISCWTKEGPHCLRMWEQYGGSPESVSIEATVGTLRRLLGDEVLIVPVCYVDTHRELTATNHSLKRFFYKRREYMWEQEIRLISEPELGRVQQPRRRKIDLSKLLYKVRVHPYASEKFVQAIKLRVGNLSEVERGL